MYYADTYALIEMLKGNPGYRRYMEVITGEPNLMELAYPLTRDYGPETALHVLAEIRENMPIIIPGDEDYTRAAQFRLYMRSKGRNLSLIDALGYTLAGKLGVKFLTGDREFAGMENVEYVK